MSFSLAQTARIPQATVTSASERALPTILLYDVGCALQQCDVQCVRCSGARNICITMRAEKRPFALAAAARCVCKGV